MRYGHRGLPKGAASVDGPFCASLLPTAGSHVRPQMHIARQCQDRALLLLQAAEECPEFKEQAEFLAHEWLLVAALWIEFAKIGQAEKETAPI